MAIFDTEALLQATETVMKANLNAELLLIDAEKADYVMEPLNANAWYFQNLDEEVYSYANFVVWGMYDNPENTDTNDVNALKSVKMFFEVSTADDGGPMTQNIFYKLLRYTRALESVIHKKGDKIRSGTRFKVSSLSPASFVLDGKTFRTAGISIEAAISAN